MNGRGIFWKVINKVVRFFLLNDLFFIVFFFVYVKVSLINKGKKYEIKVDKRNIYLFSNLIINYSLYI